MLFKGVSSEENKPFLPAVHSSTSLRNGPGAIGTSSENIRFPVANSPKGVGDYYSRNPQLRT